MSGRRSPMDVVRDAAWRLATGMLTGPSPEPRVRPAGAAGTRPVAGRLLVAAGGLAAVAITAVLVVLLVTRPYQRPVRPEEAAGLPERQPAPVTVSPSAGPATAATAPAAVRASRSPARAAGVAGSRPPAAGASVAPVPLTAGYTTTPYVVGLLGYRTEVTVANPGVASRTGWTLTVTLPRSTLWIDDVKGATVTRQDAVWTLVPDGTTASIKPGEQVSVSFEVHGATLIDAAPEDCRLDGVPCTS
ncbi:cellulose binding domain-containing protein [Actinoplanes sp. NPDC023801]|uniref:cellulose binding domain-containing protein n=1 Tax=Actinoplanes sp. NPDC023801 TaxID=3154595 RepID=UPI0033DC4FE1